METIEVNAPTEQHNYAVLHMPARRFPGVLFQGDSLSTFVDRIRALQKTLDTNDLALAREEAAELADDLSAIQQIYETAMEAHGLPLPYVKP